MAALVQAFPTIGEKFGHLPNHARRGKIRLQLVTSFGHHSWAHARCVFLPLINELGADRSTEHCSMVCLLRWYTT